MEIFKNILSEVSEYKKLVSSLKGGRFPIAVTGLSDIHKSHVVYSLCVNNHKKAVIITANEYEAMEIRDDLLSMGVNADVFIIRDFCFVNIDGLSKEYEHKRICVLNKILSADFEVLIVPIEAALTYTIPPHVLQKRRFRLEKGQKITPDVICAELISCGYEKSDKVDGIGQFSLRGGILDVFSPNHTLPVRVDFFGDEIENLYTFSTQSQRSINSLEKTEIIPAREILITDAASVSTKIKQTSDSIKNKNPKAAEILKNEAENISQHISISSLDKFINVVYPEKAKFFDYISDDIMVFVSETAKITETVNVLGMKWKEDMNTYFLDGVLCAGFDDYMADINYLDELLSKKKTTYMDVFVHNNYKLSPKEIINFNAYKLPPWKGEIDPLIKDVNAVTASGGKVLLLAGNEKFAKMLARDIKNHDINAVFLKDCSQLAPKQVVVTEGGLSAGFRYQGSSVSVISYGKHKAAKAKKKKHAQTKEIFDLSDLKKGSYVVHSEHGIGVFDGVHRIDMNGISKDYIKILYEKGDILYVPVTQMDMVSKYIGTKEDVKLKLSKLGSSNWEKTKKRVRSAVKDIAKELMKLYSERINAPGFAFSEDNEFQKDFDNRFEFDETDDQIRSINEIKNDMQKKHPMDRLLCGDVGFGKTEVALRAAFKCLADGKQCAMLVPTTILAWQHFQTVCKRFEGFPFKIELLSRFRTSKQQREIIKGIKHGDVEFVIGTHRLVQKDVNFRDLGLVIIDEEQRFGVAHKERFKELSKNVDVLTLSATPIPRTLNMAMSGIRDMSTLEIAPQDRLPVQTYVVEYDQGIVFEAIRKEIRREGQVYYLHNRIESIMQVAQLIESQIPEAVVGIAHGRMSEHELSEVWRKLIEHEINVLVCTTIIETGVDVPNANTLIIDNADCMGLSQLHQLRGRVGRSARRAYAYFTFRRNKILSEVAQKRLSAIRDFTEFGSGFKIAMRDLEIRGAGNLIGAQQHGNMEAVGYDMYIKMLEEAVKEEKGENVKSHDIECLVDINASANISEDYIQSLGQRLSMYRRVSDIRTADDVNDVVAEFKDRFGDIPSQTANLINIAYIRSVSAKMGIYEIKQRNNLLLIYPKESATGNFYDIIKRMKGRVSLVPGDKPCLTLKLKDGDKPIDLLNKAFLINKPEV